MTTRTPWNEYMIELGDYWIRECDAAAKKEGWTVFNADGVLQIQAVDEPEDGDVSLPDGDGQAYSLVAQKALEESKLHALALYLDGREADGEIFIPKALIYW